MIISNILNLEFIVVNEIYHMAVLLTFLHLVGNNPAKANYFSLNIEKLITFLHLVGNNPATCPGELFPTKYRKVN